MPANRLPTMPRPEVADRVAGTSRARVSRRPARVGSVDGRLLVGDRRGRLVGHGSSASVAGGRPAAVAAVAGRGSRRRAIVNAVYRSRTVNSPARTWSDRANAMSPPTSAPVAVNSSRVIPSRRLATWR